MAPVRGVSIPPIYAAVNAGYDVVLSGGVSPNTYPSPVTLTDVVVAGTGGSVSGCTTDCVITDPTATQSIQQPAGTSFNVFGGQYYGSTTSTDSWEVGGDLTAYFNNQAASGPSVKFNPTSKNCANWQGSPFQCGVQFNTGVQINNSLDVNGDIYTTGHVAASTNYSFYKPGTVASASTILTESISLQSVHVTGTAAISTITAQCYSGFSCQLYLIADGAWSLATGGNIASAVSASVGDVITVTYDPQTALWYPSLSNSGAVTSVALSLPSIFSVTGSPVTGSGTLTGTLIPESPNAFFAGPSSGSTSGTPAFRPIYPTDVPTLNQNTTGSAASATVATNLSGATQYGLPYQTGSATTGYVAPNTTATSLCLVQTGTGSASAAPVWGSCSSGSGSVSSVANSDSTLTVSPTTGAVVASLNTAHANTWTGKQTTTPTSTAAGFNVGAYAGNPSGAANGDLWYNSLTNALMADINGTNTALGSGGGGAVSSVSNSDSTLTISPTTGSVVASLNTAHANTWTGKQTTTPTSTTPGLNVGAYAGNPSTPSNGDLWYNTSTNALMADINGTNTALGSGGDSSSLPYSKGFIGVTDQGSSTSSITSGSFTVAAGDTVIVSCRSNTGPTSIPTTDSLSNTWNLTSLSSGNLDLHLSYSYITIGGSDTFTCTSSPAGSGSYMSMVVVDIVGLAPNSFVNSAGGSSSTSSSVYTGSLSLITSSRTSDIVCASVDNGSHVFTESGINGIPASIIGTNTTLYGNSEASCSMINYPIAKSSVDAYYAYTSGQNWGVTAAAFSY